MSGIDDPLEAVRKQYPERQPLVSVLLDAGAVLLDAGAPLHPLGTLLNAVRNFFSKREAEARIGALLQNLEWYVRENERRVDDLSGKISSPEFIETLLVAADKTVHMVSAERIKRFASVLGHELVYGAGDSRGYEEAVAYVRTLSELGEADIEVLSILHAFQIYLLSDEAHARTSDAGRLFWGMMTGVWGVAEERGISSAEYYSRCSRLNGYGLVHRVSSGQGFFGGAGGDDLPFEVEGGAHYITPAGKELIDILGNDPELLAAADEHRGRVLVDIERLKAREIDRFPQPYQPTRKWGAKK